MFAKKGREGVEKSCLLSCFFRIVLIAENCILAMNLIKINNGCNR